MVDIEPSTADDWMIDVAMMMRMDWMRKEIARVLRRRGCSARQNRAKKNAPRVKHITDVRDLIQPWGLVFDVVEARSPMNIVLPFL